MSAHARFRLVVDHHSEIDEQDESNNTYISSPFEVTAPRANVAPTASRVSPSQRAISLLLGSSQEFRAHGTDPDANISSIIWLVEDMVESGQSLDLTGSITRSFDHTFDEAGDYLVQAVFTDTNGESDSVNWDVEIPSTTANRQPRLFPTGGRDRRGSVMHCHPCRQHSIPVSLGCHRGESSGW